MVDPNPTAARPAWPLVERAIDLLQARRDDEAEPLLRQALELDPHDPDALQFMGMWCQARNRTAEAEQWVRRSLEVLPANAGALNNLANLLVLQGRADEALTAYERALALTDGTPQAAPTLANVTLLHLNRQRLPEAEAAGRRAVQADDQFATGWFVLSRALIDSGKIKEGLLANSRGVLLVHANRDQMPADAQLERGQVLHALLMVGERDEAIRMYREWLAEEPDNAVVQHQLQAALGTDAPPRASDAYVAQMFDAFSGTFDSKLASLGYRAPELIAQALQAAVGEPGASLDICDVGCGTGWCGPMVRPWARRLAGCDLSVGMLRRARDRQCYDALHRAELVYYLDTQPEAFDVVMAADVLCYFGELEGAFAAALRALRGGGWLLFSVEAMADPASTPHRLMPSGRYVHHANYLRETLRAAGFDDPRVQGETLRAETGAPVKGWVVSARKPRPA